MAKLLNKKRFVLITLIVLLMTAVGFSSALLNKGTIQSYNHDTIAKDVPILYPKSVQEVQTLIKDASERNINVRFSGTSHSTSSVILGSGLYIRSENFNRILGIEDSIDGPLVSVESGVKLGDLHEYLSQRATAWALVILSFMGSRSGEFYQLVPTGPRGVTRLFHHKILLR